MAFKRFANALGAVIHPWTDTTGSSNTTMDAVGESYAGIGRLVLTDGPGTSKTLSSAGGKIWFRTGSGVVWANVSTVLRVGVQDVSGGTEDGSWTGEVYGEMSPGAQSIGSVAINTADMTSGSRVLSHGDEIAVVIELMARGGSDVVTPARASDSSGYPYSTQDVGSGPVVQTGSPFITIQFDDGTFGWLGAGSFAAIHSNTATFGSTSTPDEYALLFKVPVPMTISAFKLSLAQLNGNETVELILYRDPLGTPTSMLVTTFLPGSTGSLMEVALAANADIAANTLYALAVRPTVNTLGIQQLIFPSSVLRAPTILGTNWSLGTRSDQSGPFVEDSTIIPMLGFRVGRLHDGFGSRARFQLGV